MNLPLDVPSSITVRSIVDFQRTLMSALESGENVQLDMANVVELDLSFIQLMHAARAYATQRGGCLGLAHPAGANVAALLDRAGFLTAPQPADLDFWFHGDHQ